MSDPASEAMRPSRAGEPASAKIQPAAVTDNTEPRRDVQSQQEPKFKIQNSKFKIPALLLSSTLLACTTTTVSTVPEKPDASSEQGQASWYGEPYHGRRTASGEIYDMYELTAAHRTLDFGTRVEVKRRDTGESVVVRINDRGPFIEGRIIDLSLAAARKIGLEIGGVAPVRLRVVGHEDAAVHVQPRDEAEEEACFWVQVGAFGSEENAVRARDRLRAEGEKAILMEGPSGLQRVRVGPLDELAAAEAARDRLLGEWPNAAVVECGG